VFWLSLTSRAAVGVAKELVLVLASAEFEYVDLYYSTPNTVPAATVMTANKISIYFMQLFDFFSST